MEEDINPSDSSHALDGLQPAHQQERARLNELFRYFGASSRAVRGQRPDIDSSSTYTQHIPRLAADPTLNALAQLGAIHLNCDRAFISLIDQKNQHILAEVTKSISLYDTQLREPGDELCLGEVPLDLHTGVCAATMYIFTSQAGEKIDSGNIYADQSRFVINDFAQEEQYKERPYVKGFPHMRFYAEVPLKTRSGYVLGSYCVVDNKPRNGLNDGELRILGEIASSIMRHLDLIKTNDEHIRSMRLLNGLHEMASRDLAREATSRKVSWESTQAENPLKRSSVSYSGNTRRASADHPLLSQPANVITDESPEPENPHPEKAAESMSGVYPPQAPDPFVQPGWTSARAQASRFETSEESLDVKSILSTAAATLRAAIGVEGVSLLDTATSAIRLHPSNLANPANTRQRGSEYDIHAQNLNQTTSQCLASSVDTTAAVDQSGRALDNNLSLPQSIMRDMIQQYPDGQIFNFDRSGLISRAAPPQGLDDGLGADDRTAEVRPDIEVTLRQCIPGVTSVIFVPAWSLHKEGWYLAMFVWTTNPTRVLAPEELSYCKAFSNSIIAEVTRVDLIATDRAKSNFISSISHELRSPLHGILASAEMLNQMQPSKEQSPLIDMINTCGQAMLDTVEHILDHSKINSLKKTPRPAATMEKNAEKGAASPHITDDGNLTQFDLSVMVEETVESSAFGFQHSAATVQSRSMVDSSVDPRNLNSSTSTSVDALPVGPLITISIGKRSSWMVRSQPATWRRVLMNVLGNSLKYTPSGLIDVSLTLVPLSSNSDAEAMATLTITDTGLGISKTFLRNHLYTPFKQENNLSSGVGLGLSIVRRLVEDLGGSIDVASERHCGTTVKVQIPVQLFETSGIDRRSNLWPGPIEPFVSIFAREMHDQARSPLVGRALEIKARHDSVNKAFASQLAQWLEIDVILVHDLSKARKGVIVVQEHNMDWLLAKEGDKINLDASSSLLIICATASPYALPATYQGSSMGAQTNQGCPSIESVLPLSRGKIKHRKSAMAVNETAETNLAPTTAPAPSHRTNDILLTVFAKKIGCDFLTAMNGREAVDKYKVSKQHIDYVLMDLSMPVMDGFAATSPIREHEQLCDTRASTIIALTGLGSKDAQKQAAEAGCNMFLAKPVRMNNLQRIRGLAHTDDAQVWSR